jgi:excisionase family DNA binding protein
VTEHEDIVTALEAIRERLDGLVAPTAKEPLRLLTIAEAAKVLGLDDEEVSSLVRSNQIGYLPVGRSGRPRIPRLALERFVERIVDGAVVVPGLARQSSSQSSRQSSVGRTGSDGVRRDRAELQTDGR